MNHEEFLNLLWRLEEMLMHVDYLRGQIGKCPEKCEGLDAEHDEGLCPVCCDWFAQVLAEEERLGQDMEFNKVMEMLKKACDEDKSGQYQRLLEQSREGKVVH
jgi:hypothetical protein